jgi:hypothetical protein
MVERTLLDSASCPLTQGIDAVKQLIAYYDHGLAPAEMPPFYRLSGEMVLVLSNKKDSYYVTTPKTCSCPAATYRPGQCKHQRRYFPEPNKEDKPRVVGQTMAETLVDHDRNLFKMPKSYQRMVRAVREDAEAEPLELISRGGFKPVLE